MRKVVLISLIIILILVGCEDTNKDIAQSDDTTSSAFDDFVQITPSTQSDTESSQIEQDVEQGVDQDVDQELPVSDMNQKTDGEFVFTEDHNKVDINMKENIYVDMFIDIMMNADNYLGKTIRVEGMYTVYAYDDGSSYNYVYRNGPAGCPCCGGSFYGIEFTWDEELPKENDWIEVVGVLDEYTEDGFSYLTLRGISVKVLDKRGKEDLS